MNLFDENEPRKSAPHEIGQKLDGLSVGDLDERIAILRSEITRLEEERKAKSATRDAAELAFKPTLGQN